MIFEGKAHGMIEGWKTEKSKAAFQALICTDKDEFISVCPSCGGMKTYPSYNHYKFNEFGVYSFRRLDHECESKHIESGGANLDTYDGYYSGYGYYDYNRYVYDHIINN
tara:strand:+ start:210 stop:536 length:327 start_codon:yes stop_codon:yes gene_type:complete